MSRRFSDKFTAKFTALKTPLRSGRPVGLSEGFQVADLLPPLDKLGLDVRKGESLVCQKNQQMIQKIANLHGQLAVIFVYCGDNGFRAFLAQLLEYLVQPLVKR